MKADLVIWGASGHARVVADIARLTGAWRLLGFLDDVTPERWRTSFSGSEIIGGSSMLDQFSPSTTQVIIAIGDNQTRLHLANKLVERGFSLATLIHPKAVVAADVHIGAGTVVAAGAVVNPGAIIGGNVIVNTLASVDHDCQVDEGVHLSPNACLAGNVTVERGAWVGAGAVVREKVRIGAFAVIGAGAAVVRDVPAGITVVGVPARRLRSEGRGEVQ